MPSSKRPWGPKPWEVGHGALALCIHIPVSLQQFITRWWPSCRYIVVKGYCSVLKHAELCSPAACATGPAGSSSTTISTAPNSFSGSLSHPVSRRATVELQAQQFALASGAVGCSGPSRRGTSEQPAGQGLQPAASLALSHAAGSAASVCQSSRQCSGALPPTDHTTSCAALSCRRVTTEQMAQQQLAGNTKKDAPVLWHASRRFEPLHWDMPAVVVCCTLHALGDWPAALVPCNTQHACQTGR